MVGVKSTLSAARGHMSALRRAPTIYGRQLQSPILNLLRPEGAELCTYD